MEAWTQTVMTSGRRLRCSALAVVFGMAAAPGAAATVSAANPQSVLLAVRHAGYQPMLDRSSVGDPMVRFRIGIKSVQILFFGCHQGQACESLQLSSGYDLPNGTTLARINAWSRAHRWGRVYLDDDDDPFLQYDIATAPAGLPDQTFAAALGHFRDAMTSFAHEIEF